MQRLLWFAHSEKNENRSSQIINNKATGIVGNVRIYHKSKPLNWRRQRLQHCTSGVVFVCEQLYHSSKVHAIKVSVLRDPNPKQWRSNSSQLSHLTSCLDDERRSLYVAGVTAHTAGAFAEALHTLHSFGSASAFSI